MFHYDPVWSHVDVLLNVSPFFSAVSVVIFDLHLRCSSIWTLCVPHCFSLTIIIQMLGFLHSPYIFSNPLLLMLAGLCSFFFFLFILQTGHVTI